MGNYTAIKKTEDRRRYVDLSKKIEFKPEVINEHEDEKKSEDD